MKKYKDVQNKNIQKEEQFEKENKEAYQNMIPYLRGTNINIYQQELIRQDLLNLVLEGQSRDERIEEVLGEDLRGVVDEIILSVPRMTNMEKTLNAISLFLNVTVILSSIKVGFSLFSWLTMTDGEPIIEVRLADVTLNIFIGLLSVLIVNKIVDDSLRESSDSVKRFKLTITVITGILFIIVASLIVLSLRFNLLLITSSIVSFVIGILLLLLTKYTLDKYIEMTYHK